MTRIFNSYLHKLQKDQIYFTDSIEQYNTINFHRQLQNNFIFSISSMYQYNKYLYQYYFIICNFEGSLKIKESQINQFLSKKIYKIIHSLIILFLLQNCKLKKEKIYFLIYQKFKNQQNKNNYQKSTKFRFTCPRVK
ncbi:hypothetical protein TTHERM_000691351 (macronuclear) [Tetrahymena thermophila SB210]|uniref:Uncharacterized protein n=1 Tax=Tetrahymena thermophila (strain SB210) TaxID=312017 RepID=W7XGT1_TETTS|nr:hypothetical protein TTHERM_000691351 [Tetrahymena thermophila SB210]EWS72184.1 hypothetical protein TTHERM_000691351 [Tetrahymena thermophila SB210]|eukprot:XP_012655277.1 hypothetical protein TTHERM_000691351 [Tetrahymena thermophila SB210]